MGENFDIKFINKDLKKKKLKLKFSMCYVGGTLSIPGKRGAYKCVNVLLIQEEVRVLQRFMENYSGGNYLKDSVEKKILRVRSGKVVTLFQKDNMNGLSARVASITMFLRVRLHQQAR